MIADYKEIQIELENQICELGFNKTKDEDFLAVYINRKGWTVILEGERYVRPAFDLSIALNSDSEEFSLWILMKVFSQRDSMAEMTPSLTNQLKFLTNNFESLFSEKPWYKEKYDEINSNWKK